MVSSGTASICRDDIAFVVLDRALELPNLPIRVKRAIEPHATVRLVGYGISELGQPLDYQTQARLQHPGSEVKYVGPTALEPGIDAPPRTFIIDGPASCFGDSGGPAIAEDGGAVVGVFSLIEGQDCAKTGVDLFYTQTPPFAELVTEAFAAAGQAPNLEPEPELPADDGGVIARR